MRMKLIQSGSFQDLSDLADFDAVDRGDLRWRHAVFDPGTDAFACDAGILAAALAGVFTAVDVSADSRWLDGADTAASMRGVRLG